LKSPCTCSDKIMEMDFSNSEERQLLVDRLGTSSINMEDTVDNTTDFSDLVNRAKEEDLTEIEKSGCLYQAGIDKLGRPVIVFIGKWFKPDSTNLDQALLYLIRVLDPGGQRLLSCLLLHQNFK